MTISKRTRRTGKRSAQRRNTQTKYWSADVTRNSNALDLEPDVFNKRSAGAIAQSLKRSAEQSSRRKSSPYQSAMSILTFYINRAGKNLSESRLRTLNRAKRSCARRLAELNDLVCLRPRELDDERQYRSFHDHRAGHVSVLAQREPDAPGTVTQSRSVG